MKKKIFALIVCMLAALLSLGVFVGCGQTASSSSDGGTVKLNKKYISAYSARAPEEEQIYFIFTSSDKGKYRYYHKFTSSYSDDEISSYTINFRYKIVDDVANCFFDSIEFDAVDNQHSNNSIWTKVLGIDVDFLLATNGNYYFCEDYLEKIPNFGVKAA